VTLEKSPTPEAEMYSTHRLTHLRPQLQVALQTELELLELCLVRQERSIQVHGIEEQYYKSEQTRLETERTALQEEIFSLKKVLEEERRLRSNKDEYDALAKKILKYPTRAELMGSLEEVEVDILAMANQQADIQRFIEKDALAGYEAIKAFKEVKKEVEIDLGSF
jgi:hypothetical protein